MKVLWSVAMAVLVALAAASDSESSIRRSGDDTAEEESSMWERILDGHNEYGSLPPRPPPASYPVHPPSYIQYTAPQPVYYATVKNPTYEAPPAPKPVHYEPPVPKPVEYKPPVPSPAYHEPAPVYYEPPVPSPVYHEPAPVSYEPPVPSPDYHKPSPIYYEPSVPAPQYHEPAPVYHEPPVPKPVYHEPAPVYHEPPVPKPVYHEPAPVYHTPIAEPTYAAPVPKPTQMTPPQRNPSYEAPAKYIPEPTYHDPESSYDEPKPVYREPVPTYQEPEPTYPKPSGGAYSAPVPKPTQMTPPQRNPYYEAPTKNIPKPTYHDPESSYDEPKPVYYEPKPTYQEPKPTYHKPTVESYETKPTYHEPKPTYPKDSVEAYEDKDYQVEPEKYTSPDDSVDTYYGNDEVCHIKVAVDCKDTIGGPCDQVHIPLESKCSTGEHFEVLTFKYENGKCNPTANSQGDEASCEDKASFAFWDPVDVYCRQASTTKNLVVEPRTVSPGGTFTVSNPGGYLPDKIDCIFRDQKGRLVQNNVFDASGDVDLYLMDSFGAMTVFSCAGLGCVETLEYHINIENLGDVPLDIEMVDFLLNDDKYHLLAGMEKRSLYPGESTIVTVSAEVEICKVGFSYDAYVYVEAYPQYGKMCMDDIRFTFKVNVPPAPTTALPTIAATVEPTAAPTSLSPTIAPTTLAPTTSPTSLAPTTLAPSKSPSGSPSSTPSQSPSTLEPSISPSGAPSSLPSSGPTPAPSASPSKQPTDTPSSSPSALPTSSPSSAPTDKPSGEPSSAPSSEPSLSPTDSPSSVPSTYPTSSPSENPTPAPSARPSNPLDGFCEIDTQVECALDNGRPCEYAEKPYTLDCVGPSYVLHFSYQFCLCDEQANDQGDHSECTDFAPLVEEPVIVQCAGTYGGHLYVSPHIVEPGQRFSVSTYDGSVLPKKIDCTVFDSNGRPLQRNIIDASGGAPLTLGDKFGSLQLDSCDEISCKEFFNYQVFISNTASDPALITDSTFFFNELSGDVVSALGTNPLAAGQSTTLDFKLDLDICSGEDYCARIIARASPPDGKYCASESKRTINFDPYGGGGHYRPYRPRPNYPKPNQAPYRNPYSVPGPTTPKGIIEMDGSCSIVGGPFAGKDPSSIDWKSQSSEVAPTRMVLRYNGKACDTTPECYDGPGGKPRGSVIVKASDNLPPGTNYNSTLVEIGGLFVFEGNPISKNTRIMVESSDGSAIYQTVFLDTSPHGFKLTEEYGSFEVVSFTNKRQGHVSVFGRVDMMVSLSAPSIAGRQSVQIERVVEDDQSPIDPKKPLDLTPRYKGTTIRPGRSVPKTFSVLKGPIDLSKKSSVTMIMEATGTLLPSGDDAHGSLRFTCFIGEDSRRGLAASTEAGATIGEQ